MQSQFLVYERRLFTNLMHYLSIIYQRFVTWDQFLRDEWHKEIFRRTYRQTLKYRMATTLKTLSSKKQNLSNEL